jgi:ubiquinone/menaquinone biosynthesis C-methylase UbiE
VNTREAVEPIAGAVPTDGGTWADFGAGRGVFTRALVERIGSAGTVYAIDRDASALSELRRRAEKERLRVIPVRADFAKEFELPGLQGPSLDGMLFANALHFVRDAGPVLRTLTGRLRPGGRVVVVEYEGRAANPWVPHPIPPSRLQELAVAAGLTSPVVTATRPSAFGGRLYVAVSERYS